MYKNQLQELAQRSCFNLPSYACIREGPDHSPRFKSTVNFNGEFFESPNFCTTLRQAEHTAAEVALSVLSKKGPSKVLAARVLDETGVYKNLLQETAHRAGLKLPVYTTVRSGPGHVPVYSCTVELAGMHFTGEQAKTKKQAQKTAAMSAWSALKILSKSSFSSSSSPTPTESGGNDEQEQVTVARYLATLQPQDTNNLGQRDRQFQCRPGLSQREVVPYRGGRSFHSSQRQKWAYSRFSPEVPMSHISPEDLASRQLGHQLALSSTPSISFRPHIFPFFQYILQPDHRSYLFAQEQEPVSNVLGIGSPLYFSNYAMPVPVRSDSGVTIREIEEKPQVEEELLNGEGDSDCRKSNLPSNVYMPSLIEVPDALVSLNSNANQIIEDMSQNTRKNASSAPNTRNLVHPESSKIEQGNRISLRPVEAKFRPRGQNADAAEFRPTNTHILNYLQSKFTPQSIHKTGSPGAVRGSVPTSFAAPVMVRAASASSLRPEGSIPLTPTPPTTIVSSACSTRPWLQETKGMRGMPMTRTMAPAVHIRSVVPVCSAPPAKRSAGPNQEGPYPGVERMRAEKQSEDKSAATSNENGKLHI